MGQAMRVLVAEDEAMIAMMLEDFLDLLGHDHAGTCASVAECDALIDEGAAFDVAILDCNLADGVVWPVARRIHAMGKPMLLASGSDGHGLPHELAGTPILGKPFSMEALGKALEAL